MKRINEFNTKLAIIITNAVSTLWCAYLFALLALVALPSSIQQSIDTKTPLPIVGWIAQTFLQLVLLSIIMVGQNEQSSKSEKRTDRLLNHISIENDRIEKKIDKLIRNKK